MDRVGPGLGPGGAVPGGALGTVTHVAPFPTPPRKRTPTGPATDAAGRGDKKKWSLGGALGGSLGGLFRRRRHKSDSSSSLEEEELGTPPASRRSNNVSNSSGGSSFLRKRRDASGSNNNITNSGSNNKKKTRAANSRVSGAFDHVVVTPLTQSYVVGSSHPPKTEQANGGATLMHFGGSFPKALNQDRPRRPAQDDAPAGPARRAHRGQLAKQRAEALRQRALGAVGHAESSSDDGEGAEGSLHSNSSSLSRFRSDDSLPNSLNRRSRAARTERYLKRLSKDEDSLQYHDQLNNNNKWAVKVTVKALSASSSPVTSPQSRPKNPAHHHAQHAQHAPNTGTFPPPSVYGHIQPREPPRDPRLDPANIAGLPASPASPASQPGRRPHSTVNGRSISYDCNMNLPGRGSSLGSSPSDVMVVQFPVRQPDTSLSRGGSVSPSRFSAFSKHPVQQAPPPPPPRDPQRRLMGPSPPDAGPGRPMSYAFEDGNHLYPVQSYQHPRQQASPQSYPHRPQQPDTPHFFPVSQMESPHGYHQNQPLVPHAYHHPAQSYRGHFREAPQSYQSLESFPRSYHHQSATPPHPQPQHQNHHPENPHPYQSQQQPEAVQQYPQRYYHTRDVARTNKPLSSSQSDPSSPPSAPSSQQQQYAYFAEQAPRSRKPIHIASAAKEAEKKQQQQPVAPMSPPSRRGRSRPSSPRPNSAKQYFPSHSYSPTRNADCPTSPPSRRTSRTRLRSADSVSSLSSDVSSPQLPRASRNRASKPSLAAPTSTPASTAERRGSLVRPIVQVKYEETRLRAVNGHKDSESSVDDDVDDAEIMRIVEKERKSTNLDDALSELEAIYKSLRLGDEDLLDRAERRDLPQGPAGSKVARNYERSSSVDEDSGADRASRTSPPRQRVGPRRSGIPDKVADDMAYRRLKQAERPPSQQDTRSIVSQAGSYLLVSTALSPAHSPSGEQHRAQPRAESPEPDVTLDDVVYRTVRQANSTLRVPEHQPPFGIPLGPVAPSSNSDYLHATPMDRYRPTFKPRRTPDVVKDDLAFRNLRKDGQRDAAGLPPNPADAVQLRPQVVTPPPTKRAARSLSANIFSLIQREVDGLPDGYDVDAYDLEGRSTPPDPNREKQDFEKAQSVSDLAAVLQVAEKVQARKAQRRKEREGLDLAADPDATPRASSCFGDMAATSTETLTGSKLDLQAVSKLATSASPTRPTPSPRSLASDASRKEGSSPSKSTSAQGEDEASNLDSLLDEMAREARETSEKLGREIQELVAVTPPQARRRRSIKTPPRTSPSPRASSRSSSPASASASSASEPARTSRQNVKLSHEEKNRLLKEQVMAQARCSSGSAELRNQRDQRVATPERCIVELSETAKSQMESLQLLTEMLSPKPVRRNIPPTTNTTIAPNSAEGSAVSSGAVRDFLSPTGGSGVSQEVPQPRLTLSNGAVSLAAGGSPRRTVSVSPGRSAGTPGTPSTSLESGLSGEDDLLPVSARVQMWNQRHNLKVTAKPPPANKVFCRKDEGSARGSSAARSATTSPMVASRSSSRQAESSDGVDEVDSKLAGGSGTAEEIDSVDLTDGRSETVEPVVVVEPDLVVPWRRRRPSLPSESPQHEAPRTPTAADACPVRSSSQNASAPPETAPCPAVTALTVAAAANPSSDSSDRDEDDKEVAALLSNKRPMPSLSAATVPVLPVLPLLSGRGPAAMP